MAATYTSIATIILGSATTTVTFSSIPQTYTDLILVSNFATPTGGVNTTYRFNGDTATNYSSTRYIGNSNGTVSSDRQTSANLTYSSLATSASEPLGVFTAYIQNYSNTTTFKPILMRGNNPNATISVSAGLWRNTAAITSVSIGAEFTANFIATSTFSLYGVLGANA